MIGLGRERPDRSLRRREPGTSLITMRQPNPIRTRLVVSAIFVFAVLAFGATSLQVRSFLQNYEISHRVRRFSSAQMVKLYIELSFEGAWEARGGYLHKGLHELADGRSICYSLSDYLSPDTIIRFRVGEPPVVSRRMSRSATAFVAPEDSPARPDSPFLTEDGAGIAVRGAGSEIVGWISIESGQDKESRLGSRRMISFVFGTAALYLAVIMIFCIILFRLTRPIDRIAEAHERARARNAELASISRTDPLTGLLNRRGIDAAIAAIERSDSPLSCVAIVDVDYFKRVNDERGHEEGDRVLAAVAEVVASNVRAGDVCGRWGGEEFVVLFRDLTDAHASAERIRAAVEARPFGSAEAPLRVTVTIGIAVFKGGIFAEALSAADDAMYRGKRGGRNRIVAA
jgi:diguanylate cyclase (GGDEF)-like protein